jgi:uncharacterized protein (TIGR02646 family)
MRSHIFASQGGICAYCEADVSGLIETKRRVEHFHPKSDTSDPNKNWALDWENVFGVCIGGNDSNRHQHPLPGNLSCDSHKDYLTSKNKTLENPEGYVLNPLSIVAGPCLFSLNRGTGELVANESVCAKVPSIGSKYKSTFEFVCSTIKILNLNCDRLKDQRLLVLRSYNREVARGRKSNTRDIHAIIAKRWFNKRWPAFFSTRRVLLGLNAERHLKNISYNG